MKTKFTKSGIITLILIALALITRFATVSAREDKLQSASSSIVHVLDTTPAMFIENVGQFSSDVRFQARGDNYVLWLTDDAIWITTLESAPEPPLEAHLPEANFLTSLTDNQNNGSTVHGVHIKLSFPGATSHPKLEPFSPLTTTLSYFYGKESARTQSNVPVWGGVRYTNLYPGIDLVLSGANTWKLICHTDCNTALRSIQLQAEGIEDIALVGNQFHMSTNVGMVVLPLLNVSDPQGRGKGIKDLAPVIENNTIFKPIINFSSVKQNQLRSLAEIQNDLAYSTFLGGTSSDVGLDIAVDDVGNTYITGQTYNGTFPKTPGAFDTGFNGVIDAFVVKLNATGSNILYGTFLGTDNLDSGVAITVNKEGEVYVVGSTGTSNFPTTPGALDRTFNGGYDIFVVKLNAAGNALIYGTYLGGNSHDSVTDITVDQTGNAYIVGTTVNTSSVGFPVTSGAYDITHNGGNDAFIIKLNPTGSALIFSTLLGGSGNEEASSIYIDDDGNLLIGGSTTSSDFPTTAGAFDTEYNGNTDLYLAQLSSDGSALLYSTFIGGDEYEKGGMLAAGPDQSVYMTGMTQSANFPVTPGTFDASFNGGNYDAFLVQFDIEKNTLLYSSFLGGSSWDEGQGIASDKAGYVYITGETTSNQFPTTSDAFDNTRNGGQDVFVIKMNPTLSNEVLYGTYLGGIRDDEGEGIATDGYGNVYITGEAFSSDFPVTSGAFDTDYNGDREGFVSKLILGAAPTSIELSGPATGLIDHNYTFTATVSPPSTTWPISYTWEMSEHPPVVQVNNLQDTFTGTWSSPGAQTITVTASNGITLVTTTHTINIEAPVQADFVAVPTSGTAPLTVNFQNLSTGAVTTCLWDFGDGNTSDLCTDPDHIYTTPGLYTVSLNVSGFGGTATISQTEYIDVYEPIQSNFTADPITGTVPLNVHFSNFSTGDFNSCSWDFGDGGFSTTCDDPTYEYENAGIYTVTLTVNDPRGEVVSLIQPNLVTVYQPVTAAFSVTHSSNIAPLTVNFQNLSTGDFTTCLWDFGDGNISNNCDNHEHTYLIAGEYAVTLTITGPGGTDSLIQTDLIMIYVPVVADFSINSNSGTVPLTIHFTNLSTGDFDTCLWNFGDGSTSHECASSSHTFIAVGNYTVTLTVIGKGGSDTVTRSKLIAVRPYQLFLPIVRRSEG